MAYLQVFQVWQDRGVLATKVLEPHLEQLKSNPVTAAPADDPDELMQPAKLDEFGCALCRAALLQRSPAKTLCLSRFITRNADPVLCRDKSERSSC